MRKVLSLFLVLSFVLSFLPVGSAFATNEKTAKELATELVKEPTKWSSFSKEEREEIKEFAIESKAIMKEIEKEAEKVAKEEDKAKVFEQEFNELNEEEQLSVMVYQTPVEIETIEEKLHNDVLEKQEEKKEPKFSFNGILNSVLSFIETPKAYAANSSNYFRKTVRAKNMYGNWLWDFWTSNNWTYDGIEIRSIDPKEGYKIYSSGWSYTGKNVESWYNYGKFDYHRNVEGYFKLSIGYNWQYATAYHDTRVRANGDWRAYSDISGNYSN